MNDTHNLYPQLEAFRFEANKLIAILSSTNVDAYALPRPITEPILPGSKELTKANSEAFENMRKNGWVYTNPDFDKAVNVREAVLINDANRGETIVFDNQTYAFSPEFRYENLEAVGLFISRLLPPAFLENETVPVFLKAWNQKLYSVVGSKLKAEALHLADSIEPDFNKRPFIGINNNGTTYISYDENGDIFLDVINSDFKIKVTEQNGNQKEKHIPGVIQLRYKFHRNNDHPEQSGFQLQWVKLSNSELGKFIFSNMTSKDFKALKKLITTEEGSKELRAELEQFSQLKDRSSSDVIKALDALRDVLGILKTEDAYAIYEMTTQILQEPFNPALSRNYLNLSTTLPQGEEIKGAMQAVVSAARSMYAPHYLNELLPKILAKLGETLEQPSIENLIALQAFQMRLSLLPGEWGGLAKKMKDLLATEAWELSMLQFRLKDNLTGLRAFLVDPEVYHQLLINLEDFAQQKDYNVIFANLPKAYANPLLIKQVKLSKDLEPRQELVDLAIYTILEDLLDSKGRLAIDIAAILNAHSPLFIQDNDSLKFSYKLDGIMMSYLDNLILPQMEATHGQKFREAFSKRFQEWQDAHPKFLVDYKSLLSPSIYNLKVPLVKSAQGYQKMWKKEVTKPEPDNITRSTPETDKTQQKSKEESTRKPDGRKH